jgi:hypothetical protein
MFHKGHYNILAAVVERELEGKQFEENRERNTLYDLAISLARRLQKDNPLFDPIRFLDACSPDPERYPISELWEDES